MSLATENGQYKSLGWGSPGDALVVPGESGKEGTAHGRVWTLTVLLAVLGGNL
jgi:hypothetical protein